ncbi:hypothetical protein BWQ96_03531 [Gracilariopsis chorda]|uniref:Uncharacterized protein n=1 Tax=Gracilariopsis chorda TaxID=448386 RepID=A0A2V3IXB0_9FLOR|nr:hypothetical protein BWQ96_03531 [Gracilariopsis chorda]|eukprot:PXF46705.1 hypothetical protein BWQ96_03531 [Gracilariopsis chorda]
MFAASRLATNSYGFSARVSACNITTPFRPSIPSRDSPGLKSTCPKVGWEAMEKGPNGVCKAPKYWRTQREKTLKKLDTMHLQNANRKTINAFRNWVGTMLVDNVAFGSIGLFMTHGKEKTVDYLVSRQAAAGSFVPWSSIRKGRRNGFMWSRSNLVSYEKSYFVGDHYLSLFMFVTFAPCSAKIEELYIAENSLFSALGSQYYYPDYPDAYSQFNIPAADICGRIEVACGNKSPYKSKSECVAFMKNLRKSGKAMCINYNRGRLSPRAAVGNTVACRITTSLMAMSNPNKYCPLLGKAPGGMCTNKMCPVPDYGNLFAVKNPRYEGTGDFSCNLKSGECKELWP